MASAPMEGRRSLLESPARRRVDPVAIGPRFGQACVPPGNEEESAVKRAALVALVAILALGAGALLWLASSLDALVEDAIEQIGSELLDAPLRVGSVSIDLQGGAATIRDLRIENPSGAGFSGASAFRLDEIEVALDLGSVTREPLVLERVQLRNPQVLAEIRGGQLNLDVLRRRVEASSAKEVATPEELRTEGEPFRIRIRRFELERGDLRLDTGNPDQERPELALPSFAMRDVGGSGGAAPAALGKSILQGVLGHTAGAAARARARDEAGAWIDDKLEDRPGAADAAKRVLDGILGSGSDD